MPTDQSRHAVDPAARELIAVMEAPRRRFTGSAVPQPRKPSGTPEDFHDPLAGLGGSPLARSALTLRAILAIFGLVFCTATAMGLGFAGASRWYVISLTGLALVAAVDLVVVLRRKRRGEPG